MTAKSPDRPSRYDELELAVLVDLFIDSDVAATLDVQWFQDLLLNLSPILELLGEPMAAHSCLIALTKVDFDPELGEKNQGLEEKVDELTYLIGELLDEMDFGFDEKKGDSGRLIRKLKAASNHVWVVCPEDVSKVQAEEVLQEYAEKDDDVEEAYVQVPDGWTRAEAEKTLKAAAKRRSTKEAKA
jgi:hypothetical protein